MKNTATLALATGLALTLLPATAGSRAAAPYTVVETGRSFDRLQDAVNAIGAGTGTIRFAPFSFKDCAVQEAGDITYIADVPGQSVLDGTVCEGKAALVLRGRSARVEGLTFANFHIPDKNGAGIRIEKGNLAVAQSWFRDSDQGILSAHDGSSTIAVDKSTFTRLGTCDGSGCAHSIYAGHYGALTVTRSRFEQGRGGHYVKCRAARIAVLNSSFDDTGGQNTNYMIDMPNGAVGRIAGNWFVQGQDKENYTAFVAVGGEGVKNPSAGLTVENNNARFAPNVSRSSTFVANWTGEKLVVRGNSLGEGIQTYEDR